MDTLIALNLEALRLLDLWTELTIGLILLSAVLCYGYRWATRRDRQWQ